MRIVATDERALALGIAPGTMLADARARVPDLAVTEHDRAADLDLLEWLADGCDRYTPMVSPQPPDGLILDLTGCSHIWGDEDSLLADLAARLTQAGFTFRLAMAETPDKARALSRYGGDIMRARRPLQPQGVQEARSGYVLDILALSTLALELDEESVTALRRAGLYTLGDLSARPRGPMAARFGEAMVAKLARVLGEEDVRIVPRRTPPALFAMRRFAEPVARTDYVLAALEDLAAEAEARLRERAEGGRCFVARLFRSDGNVRRLAIETGAPARDPVLLMRLFHERIEALSDPLDPGFGYDAIRLDVLVTEPLGETQSGLEGDANKKTALAGLADRLATRLGPSRVRRFVAADTHIPERAALTRPAIAAVPESHWPEPEAGEPPLRPLHLFDPPQPVEVIAEVPDGPPLSFTWRRQTHRIRLAEGPERIAPEWWRRPDGYVHGKAGLTRDYFRVEDESGRRFWIFRRGLYQEEQAPGWYLHGVFA